MSQKAKWRIVLSVGIVPFVFPFIFGLYTMSIESWTWADWLVLYSVIYWPTYVVGIVLILLAVYNLRKK